MARKNGLNIRLDNSLEFTKKWRVWFESPCSQSVGYKNEWTSEGGRVMK